MDRDRTRLIRRLGALVDDPDGHASACQFTGGDEADGAGADDHDVGVLGCGAHVVSPNFTPC